MKSLTYVYPMHAINSFHIISKHHIEHLSKKIKVNEVDENTLDNIIWGKGKKVLLHPIGYLLLGDKIEYFAHRIKRLYKLKECCKLVGGFDTADSDRIANIFVKVLNQLDLIVVPSTWAKECYVNSGVIKPIEVLPHGVGNAFLQNYKVVENEVIRKLAEIKRKNKAILVLFFLQHSGFRKGADIVFNVLNKLQDEYDNVYLVVKTGNIEDPYLFWLKQLKTIHIKGHLNEKELVQLYDQCDILICPSRGGGFELNALEGIARGLITLVPSEMCFRDYSQYAITLKCDTKVKVLPGNPIHVGYGYQVSLADFYKKMVKVLDNIQKYKKVFRKNAKEVRKKYAWKTICNKLFLLLSKYGFV